MMASWVLAQTPATPAQPPATSLAAAPVATSSADQATVSYPEVAYRSRNTYCNPYFGFRFRLPTELKSEPIFLPVQSAGKHMLLATRLLRLDRSAELFISAFEGHAEDPARLAAHNRQHEAHDLGLATSGPSKLTVHEHELHRVRISDNGQGLGEESSYFFFVRGYVLHVALFAHELDFADTIDSVLQHMEFFDPHVGACTTPDAPAVAANATTTTAPAAIAANADSAPAAPASAAPQTASNAPASAPASPVAPTAPNAAAAPVTAPPANVASADAPAHLADRPHAADLPAPAADGRLYYGPALPTEMVESIIQRSPGAAIPSGKFARGNFSSPELGVRVVLPAGWQPLPNDEAYHVTELMRDPTSDPDITDRRRALFRACSRVIFTAHEPHTELVPLVHPMLAIAAMPRGCVPDLDMPASMEDRTESEDFATALVRSLGVLQLKRGSIHRTPYGRLIFHLDGALPYQIPNEKLSRRLSLRVSATTSGPYLIIIYSVTATPAAQRNLESHIGVTNPETVATK